MLNFNNRRILINLSKLKKGGGQNVALNFLGALNKQYLSELEFVVAKGSASHEFLAKVNATFITCPSNPVLCMVWEVFFSVYLRLLQPYSIVYSYFGYGMYLFSNIPQVSGSADSNLYYPEIDFWEGEKGIQRLRRFLVDGYRKFGLKNSAAIVFENEELMKRGVQLYDLPRVRFIKPSIDASASIPSSSRCNTVKRDGPAKILLLCGWQRNKGILKVPQIASIARSRGLNIEFIFTAGHEDCELSREFMQLVDRFDVANSISIVDPVSKDELKGLYSSVDVVMLLSKLESFSNNIIEAWTYGVPLVIANEPWARSICNDAAIYVDRENLDAVCDGIDAAVHNPDTRRSVVHQGLAELSEYPKICERVDSELLFLLEIIEND